jgi:hypothetical protein
MENQPATEAASVSSSQRKRASNAQDQTSLMSPPVRPQPSEVTSAIAIDMKLFKEKLDLD